MDKYIVTIRFTIPQTASDALTALRIVKACLPKDANIEDENCFAVKAEEKL